MTTPNKQSKQSKGKPSGGTPASTDKSPQPTTLVGTKRKSRWVPELTKQEAKWKQEDAEWFKALMDHPAIANSLPTELKPFATSETIGAASVP